MTYGMSKLDDRKVNKPRSIAGDKARIARLNHGEMDSDATPASVIAARESIRRSLRD